MSAAAFRNQTHAVLVKVEAIRTPAQLERLSKRILTASSLQEMELPED